MVEWKNVEKEITKNVCIPFSHLILAMLVKTTTKGEGSSLTVEERLCTKASL